MHDLCHCVKSDRTVYWTLGLFSATPPSDILTFFTFGSTGFSPEISKLCERKPTNQIKALFWHLSGLRPAHHTTTRRIVYGPTLLFVQLKRLII